MKVEARIFSLIAAVFGTVGLTYWFLSHEPIGTVILLFSGGFGALCGYYLWQTGRRLDGARPEERPDAEISDGEGEIGFFPPHSWWPPLLAGGFALVALGAIFGLWLLITGAVVTLWAVSGFVMQYYSGLDDDGVPPG